MTALNESDVEQVSLNGLSGLDWQVAHGPRHRSNHTER